MAVCGVLPVAAIYSTGIVGWHIPYRHYRGTLPLSKLYVKTDTQLLREIEKIEETFFYKLHVIVLVCLFFAPSTFGVMPCTKYVLVFCIVFCDHRERAGIRMNNQHGHWVCWMSMSRNKNTRYEYMPTCGKMPLIHTIRGDVPPLDPNIEVVCTYGTMDTALNCCTQGKRVREFCPTSRKLMVPPSSAGECAYVGGGTNLLLALVI